MKKLVGFTTIVLLVLVGILGAMVMRTNQRIGKEEVVSSIAEKIGSEEFFDSIKHKLSMETEAQVEEKSVDKDVPEYDYVDQLLRLNVQMETITYECNEVSRTFKNPFYEEGSENYVSVVFYDAEHGLLLKSIGKGTDSEFFEVYKTEDGCKTWNKTTEDITF